MLKCVCPVGVACDGELTTRLDGAELHVDLSSILEYNIFFRGEYENTVARVLKHVVEADAICLDVGANIGVHTLLISRCVGDGGRVIALEPQPAICERLRRNIALNKRTNISVIEAALTDHDGEVEFFSFAPGAVTQSTSSLRPNKDSDNRITVRAVSGESLIEEANLSRCDLIKIDVEGAEAVVLSSLDAWIERWQPCVLFEYRARLWRQFDADIEVVMERFLKDGYTLYAAGKRKITPLGDAAPDHSDILCIPPGKSCPQALAQA